MRSITSLFFSLLIGTASLDVNACVLKVRVSYYPPFYSQDSSGKWNGLYVELAEVLLEEAGCAPDFEVIPWKRTLRNVEAGLTDLMLGVTVTEERAGFMNFVGPMIDETSVLLVNEDSNFKIESLDDIKKLPMKVGIQVGTYYKSLDQKLKNDRAFADKFYPNPKHENNLKMLQHNRLSATLENLYAAAYMIRTKDQAYHGLKRHPYPINQTWVYYAFSKKSVSNTLLMKLRKAYESATEKKLFQKIVDKYSS